MSKFIITTDHHSVISSSEVKDLCYSFFKSTEINSFVYARIYDNGEIYGLNSNSQWQLDHFNNEYLITPPIPEKILSKKFSFILSKESTPQVFSNTMQHFRQILKIDLPYFMIERQQDYYDLYVFCTYVDNVQIINFYINHQSYIEKFKQYFISKAKNLIKEAKKHKIIVPKKMYSQINWSNERIFPELTPIEYTVYYNKLTIIFTVKEAMCLKYLSLGYDTKGVAKIMNISPRTIEFHINNLKIKTGQLTKSRVLIFLNNLGVKMQCW